MSNEDEVRDKFGIATITTSTTSPPQPTVAVMEEYVRSRETLQECLPALAVCARHGHVTLVRAALLHAATVWNMTHAEISAHLNRLPQVFGRYFKSNGGEYIASVMVEAIIGKDAPTIDYLLEEFPVDLSVTKKYDWGCANALQIAVVSNQFAVCSILTRKLGGTHIFKSNSVAWSRSARTLYHAVSSENLEMVRFVYAHDNQYVTTSELCLAAELGLLDILTWLTEKYLAVDELAALDGVVLLEATHHRHIACVRFLMKKCCPLTSTSRVVSRHSGSNWSAIHIALSYYYCDIADTLFEYACTNACPDAHLVEWRNFPRMMHPQFKSRQMDKFMHKYRDDYFRRAFDAVTVVVGGAATSSVADKKEESDEDDSVAHRCKRTRRQ